MFRKFPFLIVFRRIRDRWRSFAVGSAEKWRLTKLGQPSPDPAGALLQMHPGAFKNLNFSRGAVTKGRLLLRSMNALTRSAAAYWQSSIGKKLVVAVTGLAMVLFLAGHLTGNMLIFAGREAFDEYAEFLRCAGHGALMWVARIGLLVVVVLHD